ncbi:6570_t:CDS:1, partial [Funneliformis geosporum]
QEYPASGVKFSIKKEFIRDGRTGGIHRRSRRLSWIQRGKYPDTVGQEEYPDTAGQEEYPARPAVEDSANCWTR